MRKNELIDALMELGENREDLKEYNKSELEELLNELTDHSNLYPNGRDD